MAPEPPHLAPTSWARQPRLGSSWGSGPLPSRPHRAPGAVARAQQRGCPQRVRVFSPEVCGSGARVLWHRQPGGDAVRRQAPSSLAWAAGGRGGTRAGVLLAFLQTAARGAASPLPQRPRPARVGLPGVLPHGDPEELPCGKQAWRRRKATSARRGPKAHVHSSPERQAPPVLAPQRTHARTHARAQARARTRGAGLPGPGDAREVPGRGGSAPGVFPEQRPACAPSAGSWEWRTLGAAVSPSRALCAVTEPRARGRRPGGQQEPCDPQVTRWGGPAGAVCHLPRRVVCGRAAASWRT